MHKGRLLRAIQALDGREVRACLSAEPELMAATNRSGLDLLQQVCAVGTRGDRNARRRQLNLAQELIERGLDPGKVKPDPCGGLPLTWFAAARARHPALVELLIDAGARPDGLYAAGWHEDVDTIELLIAKGVELEPVVEDETPFLHCFKYARYASLPPLVQAGANVNFQDSKGRTALHYAIRKPHPIEPFRFLLVHGADPRIEDKDGQSVCGIAARKRDTRWLAAIEELL